ncbi:restriction endonuclease [Flavobacterium sp. Sd200]|uniref:McrC family protein n=1 Tax=Flavobacterium sp. Sd200 TaxID=2692211 RepID=UPI00136F3B50|nr:restriction endonuclease [Flavobacterium sp. Sd200]MXN92860.1 restriction endonuclease [Flavobacterium sp. Sd200]
MKDNTIQVFEHQFLPIGGNFKQHHFVALSKLNALHNDCYFDVRHNGIKFKQYVGVIQADGLTIEILPKIDIAVNQISDEKAVWQKALIEMLRVTKKLKVQKVGEANVTKQNIHLLDIYFEWFLNEVEVLLHQGLIKQYYKQTGNVKALKGKLEFAGHIAKNLVHKERFYTSHQVYDKDHLIHQIIAKALNIIAQCTKGGYLYGKCKSVQLDFPEVKDIKATADTFTKIPVSRKTKPYDTALAIARLIILNYAPNISKGNEKMLALLFDMNTLWEEYILIRLQEAATNGFTVSGQQSLHFWNGITIRPDIVITKNETEVFIIDTKWKNIHYSVPSTHDLRQMYVYNDYWKSNCAILLYPHYTTRKPDFKSFENIKENKESHHQCGIGKISIFKPDSNVLNENIGTEILNWFI